MVSDELPGAGRLGVLPVSYRVLHIRHLLTPSPPKKMNAVMLSHTYRPRYVMHLRSEFIAVKFRTVWEGKDQVSRYFPRLNCGGKQLLVVAVERCMVPSYIHIYIHEFRDKATHSTHSIASNLPVAMSCAPVSVAASTMTWAFSSLKA